jgi:hypothetical protein
MDVGSLKRRPPAHTSAGYLLPGIVHLPGVPDAAPANGLPLGITSQRPSE